MNLTCLFDSVCSIFKGGGGVMKKYFERMRGHEKFTQPRTQGLPRARPW